MSRFSSRQTYVRILFLLSILFTATVIVCSVFLSYMFSQYTIAEIGKVNTEKTRHTVENMEFMLDKLRAYAINIYEDQGINTWLSTDNPDPLLYVDATSRLSKMLSVEPFIKNACLVSLKKKQIYESTSGLHTFDAFHDQNMLDILQNSRPSYLSCVRYDSENRSHLALFVPSTPSRQNYYGYVVLILDEALLQKYLLQNDASLGVNIVTLDDAGNLILGELDQDTAEVLSAKGMAAGKSGSYDISLKNEKWQIHYETMESQKWTVYHLSRLKDLRQKSDAFRNVIILSLLGLLSILLIVLFWYSNRTLKPLGGLAEKIQQMFDQDLPQVPAKNNALKEYTVIEQGIDVLKGTVDKLNSSMREHKGLIRSDYLQQWILHGKLNKSIQDYISRETGLLSHACLHLAVIRIESYHRFRENYDFASRKLLKFAIGNISQELLCNRGWAAEPLDFGMDSVVVLIGKDEASMDLLREALEEATGHIEQYIQSQIVVAASNAQNMNDDLKYTFDHVYELTMLKFIWGQDKVYEEKDFEEYMQIADVVPDEGLLDEIIQSVRLGNLEKTFTVLDSLIAQMQSMSYSSCKFHLTMSIYTIFRAFSKYTSLHDFDGIQSQMEKFSTLNEVSEWLKKEIAEIAENSTGRKNTVRKEETVFEVVEYVENHLHDSMLTVEDIAEHVSLSARYVRQLFKDIFDTTLSDYILDKRIERVKNLLKTTEWSVADIAERSGFQTKSHFFTAFKKVTGVTPNQYRQELKQG